MLDLIIINGLCYIDGKLKKQDIGIKNNKISEIGTLYGESSNEVLDAKNLIIFQYAVGVLIHVKKLSLFPRIKPRNKHRWKSR